MLDQKERFIESKANTPIEIEKYFRILRWLVFCLTLILLLAIFIYLFIHNWNERKQRKKKNKMQKSITRKRNFQMEFETYPENWKNKNKTKWRCEIKWVKKIKRTTKIHLPEKKPTLICKRPLLLPHLCIAYCKWIVNKNANVSYTSEEIAHQTYQIEKKNEKWNEIEEKN